MPRVDRRNAKSHLNNSSNTVVITDASRAVERSAPKTDRPTSSAQAAAAVNTKAEGVVDALPVATGIETIAVGSTTRTTAGADPSSPPKGSQVAKAVVEAACKLAMQSHCPGVCEAATLVSILVQMVSDDQGNATEVESRLKRCRLVIMVLERASLVLGKVSVSI